MAKNSLIPVTYVSEEGLSIQAKVPQVPRVGKEISFEDGLYSVRRVIYSYPNDLRNRKRGEKAFNSDRPAKQVAENLEILIEVEDIGEFPGNIPGQ